MFLVNGVWTDQRREDVRMRDNREFLEDFEIAMKVVIVGNGSVGKSSMIQRFCRGIFTRDYKKTIGVDFLERVLTIDDQSVRLMLWDTAGQEEFDAITRTYYRGASACVLACSVTDKESFLALPKWKNKVCRECGDIPMVLVANKIDLQKQAVVDSGDLEGMARTLGIPKLFRTSVKDDLNVNSVFTYLSQIYVQSVLAPSPTPPEEEELQKEDTVLVTPPKSRITTSFFGFSKSSSSNNNKVNNKFLKSTANGGDFMSHPTHKNGGGGGLLKNPVILKTATPPVSAINNKNHSNKSFFHTKSPSHNGGPPPGHYSILQHTHSPKGKGAFMLDHPHTGGYYRNGAGAYHSRSYHYMDPSRWAEANGPFRLDLMGTKKRRRDNCAIL